jgi:hypothetical protein
VLTANIQKVTTANSTRKYLHNSHLLDTCQFVWFIASPPSAISQLVETVVSAAARSCLLPIQLFHALHGIDEGNEIETARRVEETVNLYMQACPCTYAYLFSAAMEISVEVPSPLIVYDELNFQRTYPSTVPPLFVRAAGEWE